jgi:DNA mismatch repair protein MutS2
MSAFREGDNVRIKAIAKNACVVEVLGGDRYRVSLGSLAMVCRGSELALATKKTTPSAPVPSTHSLPALRGSAPTRIDLHGFTVSEALRAVETFLDRAVLSGATQVTIIHGLGSGKIQRAVHEFLRSVPAVGGFKVNDFNPGETHVFL